MIQEETCGKITLFDKDFFGSTTIITTCSACFERVKLTMDYILDFKLISEGTDKCEIKYFCPKCKTVITETVLVDYRTGDNNRDIA